MKTYEFGERTAGICLIQPVDDHDLTGIENEYDRICELSGKEFCLIAFKVGDWNKDLSPWNAPAVFGNEDFGDGATDTLSEILSFCPEDGRKYYIGGYSLAGLFALWASTQTDRFAGVAAASPSVWFPGWIDYAEANEIKTGKVYLSLGDKEEKTRNPVMRTVGDNIRRQYGILQADTACDECTLEMNQGNHFKEPDIRTAKGFAWLLKENEL